MIKCAKCESNNIHVGNKGYSLSTGFIGANKLIITCLDCGHRSALKKRVNKDKDKRLGCLIVFGSAVLTILMVIIILGALGVL